MSDPRALTDYEETLLANVKNHGCQVTSVVDPDVGNPPFSYSAGFTQTLGQGEVIVLGLAPEAGNWVINDLMEKIRAEGLRLADGLRIPEILREAELVCRAVPPARIVRDYFNSAMWFHRHAFGSDLTVAFQLVWPDPEGFYPWEADCDPSLAALQPALYETRHAA